MVIFQPAMLVFDKYTLTPGFLLLFHRACTSISSIQVRRLRTNTIHSLLRVHWGQQAGSSGINLKCFVGTLGLGCWGREKIVSQCFKWDIWHLWRSCFIVLFQVLTNSWFPISSTEVVGKTEKPIDFCITRSGVIVRLDQVFCIPGLPVITCKACGRSRFPLVGWNTLLATTLWSWT